jgi:anaerobic selenocysteine-containing dehydrogenase
MGFDEPWLHQSVDEVIAELLEGSRATNPFIAGITLERLKVEGTVPLNFDARGEVPFADGFFPTPSGKLELKCAAMAALGLDPLPSYAAPAEFAEFQPGHDERLVLISGAPHHFVSSSLANISKLQSKEGRPSIEINPEDARRRGIEHGDYVVVSNARGWCRLYAIVTDDVPPGVAVAPKGKWAMNSLDGRNVNWTTSDAVADLAGQSTFHSNLVEVRPAGDVRLVDQESAYAASADD